MSAKRQTRKPKDGPVLRAFELQHREKALVQLMERFPGHLIRNLALAQDARWCYGMLYLIGVLDNHQYRAAKYLEQVTRTYEGMLVRHGHVRAANYSKVGGGSPEDLSTAALRKMEKAKDKYDKVYGLLDKECGPKVKKEIIRTLKEDKVNDIELIREGLTTISLWVSIGE